MSLPRAIRLRFACAAADGVLPVCMGRVRNTSDPSKPEQGDEEICDLTAALPEQWQPVDPINFLKFGEDAFRRADESIVDAVHRFPLSELEILSPVPKPGQVVTVAANYRKYDPSLDGPEEEEVAAEARDWEEAVENARAGGEGIEGADSTRAISERGPKEDSEPADVDGTGNWETGSGKGSAGAENKSNNEEEEGSEEGSENSRELPPDSDDESGKSMDDEARKHLEMTLAGKERPVPVFFTKYITGTYGIDSFPPCVVQEGSQWLAGGELALIIGRMARRLSEEEAMDYVAGIAIGQDFAERDWETNESRWLYGKAYDAPIALGPVLLRRENVKNVDNLKIETWVNGVLVQVGNTRDMDFNCGQILEYVSRFMTLFPGDVVLTGRPPPLDGYPIQGVPVQVGDKITCRMSEVGTFSCTLSESDSVDAG